MQQLLQTSTRVRGVSVRRTRNRTKFDIVYFLVFLLTTSTLAMAQEHTQLKTVLQGNGLLTKNLYQILARKPGNVFFSPISIHAVLSMAFQGSEGNTREAFTRVLNVPDINVAAEGYKEVMNRLNSVKNVTLHMANKVYINDGYELQDAFKSVVAGRFSSEVESIEFKNNVPAAKTINTWVEKKTNDKIKDLIKPEFLDSLTRLVLINAIYFKGNWLNQFDPAKTHTEKFYINNEQTMDVQMMHITKKFFFKNDENLDAKVLELPYANKDISMIIILPNKRNGINELEQKLANVDLTKITDGMHNLEVIVALPKFKIEAELDLKDTLSELGLDIMFSPDKADFSKMIKSPEQLYVSKVIQKAFIEVNEEGAEAAAATGIQITMNCMPPPPKHFTADHPFVVLLQAKQENLTNVLFKGRVNTPTY